MLFNIFFIILFSLQKVNCNLLFSYNSFVNSSGSINIYSKEPYLNEIIDILNLEPTSKPTTTTTPTSKPVIEVEQTLLPTSIPTLIPTSEPTLIPTSEPTSEPTVNSKSKSYTNTNNSINISKTELTYVLVFGCIGIITTIIIVIYIYCKIYPKKNKYTVKNENENENDNIIFNINDNTIKEVYDLSIITDTRNQECNI